MGLLGDPDAVHSLAVAYASRAEVVAGIGSSFAQQAQGATWECNKATRFRHSADQLRRDCERQAGEMMELSRALLRLEAKIREQMRQLEALERRVRRFLDSMVPDLGLDGLPIPKPWDHLPWKPHNLPGRHSLDWERVARDLRNAGAPL